MKGLYPLKTLVALCAVVVLFTGIVSAQQSTAQAVDVNSMNDIEALLTLSQENWGKSAEIALQSSERAYQLATEANEPLLTARALRLQAVAYWYFGEHSKVIEKAQEALLIFKQLDDKKGIAAALNTIATTQLNLENYAPARETYLEALAIAREIGDLNREATVLANLGTVHIGLEDLTASEGFLIESLSLAQQLDNKFLIANALANLAGVYRRRGEYPQTLAMLDELIELSLREGLRERYVDALSDKGRTFNLLGEPEKAVPLFEEALVRAEQDENIRQQWTIHENLSKSLVLLGEYERALASHKAFHSIVLEERSLASKEALAELEVQFETEKQKLLISEQALTLQKTQSKQWLIVVISISVLLVISILLVLAHNAKRRANFESQIMKDVVARKRALLSDISHELKTPLTVLKLQVEMLEHDMMDDPKRAYPILHDKIDNLDRLITDVSQLAMVDSGMLDLALEDTQVLPFIRNWFETTKTLAEKQGLSFDFTHKLNGDECIKLDPVRIFQVLTNLLSNSVKYTHVPGTIVLHVEVNASSQLVLNIEDSAPGLDQKELGLIFDRLYRAEGMDDSEIEGSGLGLALCKSLVASHNGTIAASDSKLGGIKVQLTLPM